MKKFSLLSGAYVNAGDFLIVKRTKDLLKSIYPECEIIEYPRNKVLTDYLNEINKTDALIIAGGPAYSPEIYPNIMPLVEDLSQIKTKIIPIGLGWYGESTKGEYVYRDYKFTAQTQEFLKRLENDAKWLSCRDYYSYRVLKNNGFEKVLLTGCPAWYDIDKIEKNIEKNDILQNIKKISISDPAKTQNIPALKKLIEFINQKYPTAEINVVFHRVENDDKAKATQEKLEKEIKAISPKKIKCHNISYQSEGFKIYNECDFHIGFRVHAHIYNLSQRIPTILIEEDGRGAGVNEALGLPTILAYEDNLLLRGKLKKIVNKVLYKLAHKNIYKTNKYLINEINTWINILEKDYYKIYSPAITKMQFSYNTMREYIIEAIK